MTREQTGLLRFSVGRVGLAGEPPLFAPDGASWEGDRIDLTGSVGGFGQPGSEYADWTLADAKALRDQLRGLGTAMAPQPFVVPDDPTLGCWVEVDSCQVDLVDLFTGEFDWSITLTRIAARSQLESLLLHGLRSGSDVTSGNGQPLVGVPPSTLSYRRASTSIGDLAGRAISDDAGGGEVLVDVWADDDAVEPAYWACRPGGAFDGAARLRVGGPLEIPSLLRSADWWVDHRSWEGLGEDLADLSGGGNDATPVGDAFRPFRWPAQSARHALCSSPNVAGAYSTPDDAAYEWDGGGMEVQFRARSLTGERGAIPTSTTGCNNIADQNIDGMGVWDAWEIGFWETGSGAGPAHKGLFLEWTPDGGTSGDETQVFSDEEDAWVDDFATYMIRLYFDEGGEAVARFYRLNPAGAVVSSNSGRRWTLISEHALGATSSIEHDDADWTIGAGGWSGVEWMETYDDIDGATMWAFDVDDGAPGKDDVTTGSTTWTRENGRIVEAAAAVDGIVFGNPSGASFTVADDPGVDLGAADATVAVRFDPLVTGQAFHLFLAKFTGTFGVDAVGWLLAEAVGQGGVGAGIQSTNMGMLLDSWTPDGPVTLTGVIDRTADTLAVYLDGTSLGTPADISTVGDLDNTADLGIGGGAGIDFYGAAIWKRSLTAAEVAHLNGEFGGSSLPELVTIDEQLAAMRTIVGDRLPGDVDPDAGWVIDNGLVRAYPAIGVHPSSGERGGITVECWDGTAWESATDWFFASTGGIIDGFASMAVLANDPHEVRLRLTSTNFTGDLFESLFLTIRRGDRMVAGVVTATETTNIVVQAPAVSSTSALTGGERADADDADGNRAVAATGLGAATGGPLGVVLNATALDFGVGHEIGGSGSSSPDTAQDLADQYAAWVSESIALRGTPA